jgi:Skp family chaperone for outer membrane proteins
MKKSIFLFSLVIGIAVSACQSQAEKDAKAEDRAQDSTSAKQANDQYLAFKRDADSEINGNNEKIAHLRERLAKTQGNAPLDGARKKKIDDLQKRNLDLRATIDEYKYQSSDWESFKAKWYSDRDSVRNAFRDTDTDISK